MKYSCMNCFYGCSNVEEKSGTKRHEGRVKEILDNIGLGYNGYNLFAF